MAATGDDMEEETLSKWESLRLKTLAEKTYISSDLKSALKYAKRAHRLCPALHGISETLTAFKILAAAAANTTATPQWYKILEVEPFSHISTIKKSYKKLALILHPDKNSFIASEEAFKLVNEAFSVLSDKIRRKEYDMKLRIALQNTVAAAVDPGDQATAAEVDTFWTACSTCRLLHQFERKYLGHILICPNCKKSFKATDENQKIDNREKNRIHTPIDSKRKMSSVGEIMKRSAKTKIEDVDKLLRNLKRTNDSEEVESMTLAEMQKLPKRTNNSDEDESMTLAEMQKLVKTNPNLDKSKPKKKKINNKLQKNDNSKTANSRNKTNEEETNDNQNIMTVVDSDFYDFDKGRVEKSFKKGQIWALYDDNDGMPRNYALIDEVISTNPFEVNISWLDPQINGDDSLMSLQRTGFHNSCGRFKISKKTKITSLNVFSHIVDCERTTRDVYMIYPKKGSVWAVYRDNNSNRENGRFDIVVLLTSCSEAYGLSMGYLEKVGGFKTIFRRQEIGFGAIKWVEIHKVRVFSHQIPARKLSGEEGVDCLGDCWELDPASLPSDLLIIDSEK